MRNKAHIYITLTIALLSFQLNAQDKTPETLISVLSVTKNDTTRLRLLSELSEVCEINQIKKYCNEIVSISEKKLAVVSEKNKIDLYNNYISGAYNNIGFFYSEINKYDTAAIYYLKALDIQKKILDSIGIATTFNNLGLIFDQQNNTLAAIGYFEQSIALRKKLNDREGLAGSLINVGFIYNKHGNVNRALDNYQSALKIYETDNNKKGVALALNNIAYIYQNQNDVEKASEYYNRAFAIQQQLKDKNGIANSLNNLGLIFSSKKEYANAIRYFNKCLKLRQETGDKKGIANSLNNIATIYTDEGNYDVALNYYIQALNISIEIGDKKGMALEYNNIGIIYNKKGNSTLGKKNGELSLALAKELALPESIMFSSMLLFNIHKKENNASGALEMYELYIQMRDSINNRETRKASIRSQLKYEYEKKAAADSIKTVEEKKISQIQLKQEKKQRYFLYSGLLLTLVFGVSMLNRFLVTSKQKNIISQQKMLVEEQKRVVEEKQKEIMDSIHYAKRIQTSLLPTEKYINKNLNIKFNEPRP
ncbi:MAG: tetratricopeptide repeat protein [Bacteroidia bacterium]|nr:tetratricopeptide repeat protein [Bacteroidia bacterium]